MKCPKCDYVSFEGLDTCKNCGYSFATGKMGKKQSFFSRLLDKFKGDKTAARQGRPNETAAASVVAEEGLEAVTEEPSSEEASAEVIPGDNMSEPGPAPPVDFEALTAQGEKEEAPDSTAEDAEAEFDTQFDGLFGDDKNAEKGGKEDQIKITATDNLPEIEEKNAAEAAGFGLSDPFDGLLVNSADDTEKLFKKGVESSNDYFSRQEKGDSENTIAEKPAPDQIDTDEGSQLDTSAEESTAADFINELESQNTGLGGNDDIEKE